MSRLTAVSTGGSIASHPTAHTLLTTIGATLSKGMWLRYNLPGFECNLAAPTPTSLKKRASPMLSFLIEQQPTFVVSIGKTSTSWRCCALVIQVAQLETGSGSHGLCSALSASIFFCSHSWYDDPVAKFESLQQVAASFSAQHGRPPTFWFDKACIQQDNIGDGLRVLPQKPKYC